MSTMSAPKNRRLLFLLGFVYVAVPLLVYLWRYRLIAPVYLFSDDAFYYLDIARNSLGRTGFTFDGQHISNGFHPLWEWVLVGLGKLGWVHYSDLDGTLMRVFFVNTLLLGVAAGTFCAACARYFQPRLLALLTVAPGVFWLLFAAVTPAYFSTWYYANGMESALALLFFSLALLLYDDGQEGLLRLAAVGVCLGLAVLARLDDVFLALAIAGWIVLRAEKTERVRKLFALSPIALLLAAYLTYNRVSVGVFLPLSGAAKASVAWGMNLKWVVRLFVPIFTGDPPLSLMAPGTRGIYLESTVREIQMVFPAVIAVVELVYVWRRRRGGVAFTFLHAAAVGVIVKAAYNILFVENFDQGLWYYTV
ncbi:MAG: hypothetical protein ABI142_04530, partial [Bryocella sp.]